MDLNYGGYPLEHPQQNPDEVGANKWLLTGGAILLLLSNDERIEGKDVSVQILQLNCQHTKLGERYTYAFRIYTLSFFSALISDGFETTTVAFVTKLNDIVFSLKPGHIIHLTDYTLIKSNGRA